MKNIIPVALIFFLAACSSTATPSSIAPVAAPLAVTAPAAETVSPTADTVIFPNVGQQAYTDPDGQFTIVFPANWQAVAQPSGGVVFVDPTARAAFGVQFTPTDHQLSPESLTDTAVQFATANFGSDPGFKILSQANGIVQFKNDDPQLGATINQIKAAQFGQMVYFTQMTIVESLWAQTVPALQAMADTLHVLRTEVLPTPTAPLVWKLYTSPPIGVVFLVASNWQVSETENAVTAEWQSSGMTFTVAVEPAQNAEQFLQGQLDLLAQTDPAATHSDIIADTTGDISGYKADYLYSSPDDIKMAASSFAGESGGKLYHVKIAAPQIVFSTALDWFIPMLESLKIVNSE